MSQNKPGGGRPPVNGKADDRTRIQGAAPPPQRKAPKRKKKARKLSVFRMVMINIMKAVFVVFCVGLMVGSVIAVQLVQYVMAETNNDDNILDLDDIKLNQTSYIMVLNPNNPNAKEDDDWIIHQELIDEANRIWVSDDKIPDDLKNAVVATEDREFYTHHGVSFTRTIYAALNEVLELESRSFGASTIDQQLVKNLTGDDVVTDEQGDRFAGYRRKLREIFRAWSLNNRYSKDMIMEAYLNTMGLSERIAGVEAGAQEYFGKHVEELSLVECATIAGITQAPTKYSPYQNPDACLKRRNDVLTFMREEEYITEAEYRAALDEPLVVQPRTTQKTNESGTGEVFDYVSDTVFNEVIKAFMERDGYTRAEAVKYVYNNGLRIYATADMKVQNVLADMYAHGYEEDGFFMDNSRFPNYKGRMTQTEEVYDENGNVTETIEVLPQSSCVVLNYDGEIVAIVGGIGEKTESLSLNRAVGTLKRDASGNLVLDGNGMAQVEGVVRQVGSTMKPIGPYALGIDKGIITYSSIVQDSPVQEKKPGSGKLDWPTNYSKKYRETGMPILSAVAESTNTVAAQVGLWVTREEMFEFLTDTLQISSLQEPHDVDIAPLALGSMTHGMSAVELAGAYMMFGGNDETYGYGAFVEPHSFLRVEDSKGNILLEPDIYPVQAIDEQSGFVMNRLLHNVIHGSNLPLGVLPTAKGMAPEGEMDSIAKTGTTSDDRDRWFVGLTPYYVTAVWWGYDVPDQHNLAAWPPSGVNIPPHVFKYLMTEVQKELPVKEFPEQPEGIIEGQFCSTSGELKGPHCPNGGTGYYTSFNTPHTCTVHTGAAAAPPAA